LFFKRLDARFGNRLVLLDRAAGNRYLRLPAALVSTE
jgi:hypothetical protein